MLAQDHGKGKPAIISNYFKVNLAALLTWEISFYGLTYALKYDESNLSLLKYFFSKP